MGHVLGKMRQNIRFDVNSLKMSIIELDLTFQNLKAFLKLVYDLCMTENCEIATFSIAKKKVPFVLFFSLES